MSMPAAGLSRRMGRFSVKGLGDVEQGAWNSAFQAPCFAVDQFFPVQFPSE